MHKVVGFADGENLVHRYQDMVKQGATPAQGVVHVPDLIAWHPQMTQQNLCEIGRISYYQTVSGDEQKIDESIILIAGVGYRYTASTGPDPLTGKGMLAPRVFKKAAKSTKTKSVDINITVDMMRQVYGDHFDVLYLMSGDGDYFPLVEEAVRRGKQVWIAAFSSGLSKHMRYAADEFINLDKIFFEPKP